MTTAKTSAAKLTFDGTEAEMPMVEGSLGELAVDISSLRKQTGVITLDNGYGNTGSCFSAITFIDGDQGILLYRGYPIEQLAEKADFTEVSYLLVYGHLPTKDELERFRRELTSHSLIHEDMKKFFEGYPPTAHPMAILSAMVASLSAYYPDDDAQRDQNITRLLAKLKTIAAFSYKKSIGQPYIYPRNDLGYASDFLHMMHAVPAEPYELDKSLVEALNLLLILHADHEQNCSASTVRMVGSSGANLFASIAAGICALWGPLHGGANQKVIQMLERIQADGSDYKKYVRMAKDKNDGFRLMGFGHRVYRNFDPRAKILKASADKVLAKLGVDDPLLEIAKQLEEVALNDDYFIQRKLYPNVDFYSGILYRAMGIPTNMFTVMFALGRLPGWIAQWKEMLEDPDRKIYRPRQIYTGEVQRDYVPIGQRWVSAEVELWLVRHGQTEWNADGKVCGWFDAALTEHGREQARGLRGFLAAHQFTSVWSSDLSRAVETARLALGPARADARLREFHFGDVEGLVWHDLDPAVRDRILEFEGFRAPNGEDMQAFQERVYEFVDGLHPGRHLLFVHAGLIRLLLRAVDNDKVLPPASVAGLEWTRRRFLFIREGCAAV